MVTYLSNKPVLSILCAMIGIGLLVAAIVINPFKAIKASAGFTSTCGEAGYDRPTVKAEPSHNYASNWIVTQWLRYDGTVAGTNWAGEPTGTKDKSFPIGPSAWLVCGKNRNGSEVTDYQEKWQLDQVRLASSRANKDWRGQAINRTGPQDFGGAHLNVEDSFIQASGDDRAFKNPIDTDWDPVGLYGILRDSKDDLNFSRSFFPSKWSVTGTY